MTYDWTVPSLLAQGVKYYPNKSSDGVVDVRVFLTQVAKLLQDGLEYLGEAGTTSKELQAAIDAIPTKADSSAAWVAAARAWMTFLDNARITSKVPYPATPDNLPKLHGKKCWKNVQHYKQCPARVTTNFTGGAVTSNHVFVYQNTDKGWVKLDKSPDASGRYNMEDVEGTEVCILRDTRTYGEKDSTDGTIWAVTSPTPEQMRDIAKWTMLATMDAGGVSTEVPKDKSGKLSVSKAIITPAVASGLPEALIEYSRSLLFQDGWGTFMEMGSGGAPWPGPDTYAVNDWTREDDIPRGGDLLFIWAWPSQYDGKKLWYIGTSPTSDPIDMWPVSVISAPDKLPDASGSWKVPDQSRWTARAGRCGIYLSDSLDLTNPDISVHTWYGATFRGICGSTVPVCRKLDGDKFTTRMLHIIPMGSQPLGFEPRFLHASYPKLYQLWDDTRSASEWPRRLNMVNANWTYRDTSAYGSYDTELAKKHMYKESVYTDIHYQSEWGAPDGWVATHPRRQTLPEISPNVLLYVDDTPDMVETVFQSAYRFTLSWILPSRTRIQ